MSVGVKIRRIIGALLMFLFSFLLIWSQFVVENGGISIIMVIVAFWLVIYGIRILNYYSRMARFMVGGKTVMILGFVFLDLGLFTMSLLDAHPIYIILYLLAFYAFSGAIDVMRAFEQKGNESRWKLKLATGFIEISIALTAFISGVFFRSTNIVVIIFALGLAYTALAKVIDAFRKQPMMSIL
jgi:uncharacterized membrane protein HdeD (DUF308 family)